LTARIDTPKMVTTQNVTQNTAVNKLALPHDDVISTDVSRSNASSGAKEISSDAALTSSKT